MHLPYFNQQTVTILHTFALFQSTSCHNITYICLISINKLSQYYIHLPYFNQQTVTILHTFALFQSLLLHTTENL
jgi:hypothetical protein